MAYSSLGRPDGVHVYEEPVKPEAMVLTVFRSLLAPSLSRRVTEPLAPVQVMVKGWPSTGLYTLLVSWGMARTWAMAAEKATRRALNCIVMIEWYDLW